MCCDRFAGGIAAHLEQLLLEVDMSLSLDPLPIILEQFCESWLRPPANRLRVVLWL